MIERTGGCACPIRGARVTRLRSSATKRPIRGRELIKVRDLFKEIRYIYCIYIYTKINELQQCVHSARSL